MASPFFTFSFSVSLFFFSYFLPSCLSFLLSFCFLFLSFFSFFFLVCFCFMKTQHQNIKLQSFSSSILSHFCWFPLFFFLANSLSLSLLFFLILSFVFCSTSVFGFKECKFKKHIFQKKGVQHNVFLSTCVLQNVKSYRFFLGIFAIFLDFQQSTS